MSVVDDLKTQIGEGRITFDPPDTKKERLKKELLGENDGVTKVTEKLQKLVYEVSKLVVIQISSIIRTSGHHGTGRAFDVGNEAVALSLLPSIVKKVEDLGIDEIIFDAGIIKDETDRNKWNHDGGKPFQYDEATLDQHKNHIHFAVKAG